MRALALTLAIAAGCEGRRAAPDDPAPAPPPAPPPALASGAGEVVFAGANPTLAVVAGDRLVWVDAFSAIQQEVRAAPLAGGPYEVLGSAEYIPQLVAADGELAWIEHEIAARTSTLVRRARGGAPSRIALEDGAPPGGLVASGDRYFVRRLHAVASIARDGRSTPVYDAGPRTSIDGPFVHGDRVYALVVSLAADGAIDSLDAWEEARGSPRGTLWVIAGAGAPAKLAEGLTLDGLELVFDDREIWMLSGATDSIARMTYAGAVTPVYRCAGSCMGLVDGGDALYFATSRARGPWDGFARLDKTTGAVAPAIRNPGVAAGPTVIARGQLYWNDGRGIVRAPL